MTISTTYTAVNVGTVANDGTGDNLRTAFDKVNQNFGNIYTDGVELPILNVTGTANAAYFAGDGSLLTNLPLGTLYGNANVATYLPTYSGNLNTLDNVTVLGNIILSKPLANIFVTGPMGFVSNAGSIVTQGVSKANIVSMSKVCGQIVTHNAALGSDANVGFRFYNEFISSTDVLIVNIGSGATSGAYRIQVENMTANLANIRLYNVYGASLSEAITLNYALIKAVAN
jgi:hypothetical protein